MVSTWANSSTYPMKGLEPAGRISRYTRGMPAVLADLSIEARWIVPMTSRRVLQNHALVVRDGRILDLLPSALAAERYAATAVVQRPAHLLMPGLINTHTYAATSLFRGQDAPIERLEGRFVGPEFVRDGALAAIAEMLRSGITCFGDRYYYPDQTALAAGEQGIRAVIGLPVADTAGPSANSCPEYLTEGLRVRDEYAGHPLISTVFAPHSPGRVSDATFTKVATLADELDAGIMVDLHHSAEEIARSVAVHGVRPIERLWRLGLLTPALNAVHMTHATAPDIDLAQRTGIAVSLCVSSGIQSERQLPPVDAFAGSGIRFGVGSGGARRRQDVWGEMKLLALDDVGPESRIRHGRLGCSGRGHPWRRLRSRTGRRRRHARVRQMGRSVLRGSWRPGHSTLVRSRGTIGV